MTNKNISQKIQGFIENSKGWKNPKGFTYEELIKFIYNDKYYGRTEIAGFIMTLWIELLNANVVVKLEETPMDTYWIKGSGKWSVAIKSALSISNPVGIINRAVENSHMTKCHGCGKYYKEPNPTQVFGEFNLCEECENNPNLIME